jgi:hypothetical protein
MNAITLASSTARRIGQLVRMLGSDKSGEVVAAAAAINRTLFVAGLDLHQLADLVARGLQQQAPRSLPPRPSAGNSSITGIVAFCAFPGHSLSERERDFIRNLESRVCRYGTVVPTIKQHAWLLSIYQRLRGQP